MHSDCGLGRDVVFFDHTSEFWLCICRDGHFMCAATVGYELDVLLNLPLDAVY